MSAKIKKDIISVIGGRVFTSGLYFAFLGILMAVLSVEDYGKYTYYYSLIAIVPFFMDLGTNNAFLSLGAKKLKKDEHEFELYKSNYLAIKYLLFIIYIFLIAALYFFDSINYLMLIVLFTGILFALQELLANLFAVRKQFDKFSLLMPVRNVLNLIIVATFIMILSVVELNANNSIIMLTVATAASLLFYFIYNNDFFFNKAYLDFDICRSLCSYSSWLVVYGFCTALMMRIDIFILEYYNTLDAGIGRNELGYFSAAFSLGLVLPMITNSIVKVAFPNLSQINCVVEVDKYLTLIKKAVIPVLLSVFGFSFLVILCVKFFLYQKYGSSIDVFLVISLATIVSFFTNLLIPLFYASNNTFFIAKLGISQLLINIVSSFCLIYFYGALGAAISILIVRTFGLFFVTFNIKAVREAMN